MANYFYLCRPANQSAACAEIGSMAAPTTDWSDVGRPRTSLSLAQCIDTLWSVYRTRSVLCGQCFLLSLLPDWSLPYLLLLYILLIGLFGCGCGHSECGQAPELFLGGSGERTCWSAWSHAGMRLCWRHAWLRYNRLLWSCWSWWISKWLWRSSRSRIIAIRLYYRSTASKWSASIAAAAINIAIGLIGYWCVCPVMLRRRKALRNI